MSEFDIDAGCTRLVLLFPSFVVKLPRLWYNGFKRGRQANTNELGWFRWRPDTRLCPVLWADRFGLMLIMRRALPAAPEAVWEAAEAGYFAGLPLDCTPENVGRLGDRLVMLDYGALSYPPPGNSKPVTCFAPAD